MKDYPIIEYCNPYQPDIPMFKCMIGNNGLHSADIEAVKAWRKDRIDNANEYKRIEELSKKAAESFFAGTNTSKD
jgi:hypothetical protein